MEKATRLLKRLDDIGQSLKNTHRCLALLALGSVGKEINRLDEFSDLDFFVIVKDGQKQGFIEHLDWLSDVYPLAFVFKNTRDGYKVMFEDHIFCEFAVFEAWELSSAVFTEGRLVWHEEEFDVSLSNGKQIDAQPSHEVAFLVGEALTNLYVGMCRYLRGEKLSAARFVQVYAVDTLIELSTRIETPTVCDVDVFSQDRRYEQRYRKTAMLLPLFLQGYEHTPASTRAMLAYLDQQFEVNQPLKEQILMLCERADPLV